MSLTVEEYVRQVKALFNAHLRADPSGDIHERCDIVNEMLCTYGSAMEMPVIAVAYVAGINIKVDILGAQSVLRRNQRTT